MDVAHLRHSPARTLASADPRRFDPRYIGWRTHMIGRAVVAHPGLLRRALLVLTLAISCTPMTASAQSVSGTILGTVTDSSGSVIQNAKVTVVNEGTGLTRTVQADSNGEYTIPSLPT